MDPMMMMMLMSAMGSMAGGPMGGKEGEFKSTYNPNQLGMLDQILNQVKGGAPDITQNQGFQGGQEWLNKLYNDPEFFKSFEQPMIRNFEENLAPDIANRFAGMGSGGALGSSAFRNQMARETGNLQTNLAALKGGMQQQGLGQALQYGQAPFQNYMQQLMTALQPTQNVYQPPTAGFFGDIMSSLAGGAAKGYGQKWGESMV